MDIEFSADNTRSLNKFYDVKSLYLTKVLNGEISEQTNGSSNKKVDFAALERAVLGNVKPVDLTDLEDKIPVIGNILESCKIESNPVQTKIMFEVNELNLICDVYIKLPRSVNTTLECVSITPQTKFCVQSRFNLYYTEGFTLALRHKDFLLSIYTSNSSGMKGLGEVLVSAFVNGNLYVDKLSKYVDVSEILNKYIG